MEGKLLKWTNYLYDWQERFCVLKGAIFSYYIPNSESHMPKGRVHLAISTIKENLNNNENLSEEDKNSDLGFEINTGSTVYFFKANNIEDKNNWIKIIKRNKVEAEKNIKEYFDKKNNEDKYSQLKDYVSNLIAEQNFHSDLENKLKLAINDIDNNRIQQPQSMRLKSRNQLSLSKNKQCKTNRRIWL